MLPWVTLYYFLPARVSSAPSVFSVLKLLGIVLDHSGEESVGSIFRRKSLEKSIRADETFDRDVLSQNALERASRRDDAEFVQSVTERFVDGEFIFFRLEGRRGIHQSSARRESREGIP